MELASDAQIAAMTDEGGEMEMDGPAGAMWGEELHREMEADSLSESVCTTLGRDAKRVGRKLLRVVVPVSLAGSDDVLLRDWDLWGPLLLCLLLSILLSFSAPPDQSALVFALVFALVWLGALVVTLNAQLLGGELSLLQSVCVLGYCIFPMIVATLACSFVDHILFRMAVAAACWAWASLAARSFIVGSVPQDKRVLAVYPIALFYLTIGWLAMVRS